MPLPTGREDGLPPGEATSIQDNHCTTTVHGTHAKSEHIHTMALWKIVKCNHNETDIRTTYSLYIWHEDSPSQKSFWTKGKWIVDLLWWGHLNWFKLYGDRVVLSDCVHRFVHSHWSNVGLSYEMRKEGLLTHVIFLTLPDETQCVCYHVLEIKMDTWFTKH